MYPQEAANSILQRQAKSAQAPSQKRHIDRDPLLENYYGQLLEGPEPSSLHALVQAAQAETAADPPTELIFQLDRRGEGWGEEIFPTLTVVRRPVVAPPKRDRNRSKRPPPWTVSSCCCSRASACQYWLLAPVRQHAAVSLSVPQGLHVNHAACPALARGAPPPARIAVRCQQELPCAATQGLGKTLGADTRRWWCAPRPGTAPSLTACQALPAGLPSPQLRLQQARGRCLAYSMLHLDLSLLPDPPQDTAATQEPETDPFSTAADAAAPRRGRGRPRTAHLKPAPEKPAPELPPASCWQEGSAELFLRDVCGVPEERVDAVLTAAVAWRYTAAGRPLIDRRRRSRVERNAVICAEYLVDECGIAPGGADLQQACCHLVRG